MSFKIRDLMISVLPAAGGRQGEANAAGCAASALGCVGCTGTVTGDVGCIGCTGTTNVGGLCLHGFAAAGCVGCTGTTGQGCAGCTGTITNQAGCGICTGTTGGLCAQGGAAGACTPVSPVPADRRPQALAELRQRLQAALAEVDQVEKRLEEEMFPRSAEEAEELEKKLEAALEEVRSRKGGLPKKG